MKEIKILDCTLRDGGYYNNWDFSRNLVNDYLNAVSKVGINYVELGFRSLRSKNFKGSNWHTTDDYINNLKIPKKINLVIMINASEIIASKTIYKTIKMMFKSKIRSNITLVRIA